MIIEYQHSKNDINKELTDIMIQIRTDDLDDFLTWLDVINSWYNVKQSKKNLSDLLSILFGVSE